MVAKYVLAFGEALIDFTSSGVREGGGLLYEQNAGGAPANVACALARLGSPVHFWGAVGKDMFGIFLRGVLQREGVDVTNLLENDCVPTTLAFVALREHGERDFAFVRHPGADTTVRLEDLNLRALLDAAAFHCGTLSLTHEPSSGTLLQALSTARQAGVVTSLDVNLRPALWSNLDIAHRRIHQVLPLCDVVKVSGEELMFTQGLATLPKYWDDVVEPARKLLAQYPSIQLLCVTLGAQGSMALCMKGHGGNIGVATAPAYSVTPVDTTGAGDAFTAAILHQILKHDSLQAFLDKQDSLNQALRFANVCAALCVTKRGAIASMPYLSEVQKLL